MGKGMCERCLGTGKILIDIRALGISDAGMRFLTAGQEPRRYDDGSVKYEMVCPRCDDRNLMCRQMET